MKKLFLLLPILLLSACNLGEPQIEVEVISDTVEVADEDFVCGRDKVKDADGNEYKTAYFDVDGGQDVFKDGQCWMAENLNVGTKILNPGEEPSDDGVIEKWCLNEFIGHTPSPFHNKKNSDSRYCNEFKYGGLYSWGEAIGNKTLCPDGWQIPNEDDWILIQEKIRPSLNSLSPWLKDNEESVTSFVIGEEINFPINVGGFRLHTGEYEVNSIFSPTYFWALNKDVEKINSPKLIHFGFSETGAWLGTAIYEKNSILRSTNTIKSGLNIRCIKK